MTHFIGRFHVVLLHLPIGLLMALGLIELISLNPRWRQASGANRYLLFLAAPLAVLTAICGWLLAKGGGYDERLLSLHRWTGIGVAVAACVLLLLDLRGWVSLYRVLVWATMVLTVIAGHFGGSLTHGRDYLTRYAPTWLGGKGRWANGKAQIRPEGDPIPYTLAKPVFAERCIRCHGPEKSKGGLRLDSFDRCLAGGDSGPAILPGDTNGSLLLKRLLLPLDDDDHMPPYGKPQPTREEIDLIRNWILSGAAR